MGTRLFRQAQWSSNLFVARIHGAIEDPTSIVLSQAQCSDLMSNDAYVDLLRQYFVNRNVIFLGFSFYDPAIRHVFEDMERRFGAASPGRHLALVPKDAGSDFLQKASRLNLTVVRYDPDDNHSALWKAIAAFTPAQKRLPSGSAFLSTKRFLAACFARSLTKDATGALRESIAEGVVSAFIQANNKSGIDSSVLIEKVRTTLGIMESESRWMIDRALSSLLDAGLCVKDASGDRYLWSGETTPGKSLDGAIEELAESVRQRARLQEHWELGIAAFREVKSSLYYLVEQRGWDLGAAFAMGRAPEGVDLEELFPAGDQRLPAYDRERMLRVFGSILQNPTTGESALLSDLGKVSFALQIAFHSPSSTLTNKAILPRRIYIDASVLLPAIVEGHPFQSVYKKAIKRLRDAATEASHAVQLCV